MSIFSSIPLPKLKKNTFNLTHDVKTSFNMSYLVPFCCEEVLPNTKHSIGQEVYMRFTALQTPVMHNVNAYIHYFFVPTRLIWKDWEDFITGGEDGKASPVYPTYQFKLSETTSLEGTMVGTLADYLGFPVWGDKPQDAALLVKRNVIEFDALPFRAYQRIYNDYYRDQNLEDEVILDTASGSRSLSLTSTATWQFVQMRQKCWEKDYFTSALPFVQRGDGVSLPLGKSAKVNFKPNGQPSYIKTVSGGKLDPRSSSPDFYTPTGGDSSLSTSTTDAGTTIDNSKQLEVDLSTASSVTINELRRASRLQEWLERSARGGSRYIEQILSHFGVKGKDSRLQRAQFLGGTKQPVVISEVMQTSQTTEQSPLGEPAGKAISVGTDFCVRKRFFDEHGYIIGIICVLPRTSYFQGMPRKFLRRDKLDFYWPSFAHLGEQEIYNEELYYDFKDATGSKDKGTFGYTPRYAEYKYSPSTVHGDFRFSLDAWHMGRKFTSLPPLNDDFVRSKNITRIFPYESQDVESNRPFRIVSPHELLCQIIVRHKVKAPMPRYGVPRL